MSHIAKLGGLTDKLITVLTHSTPKNDPARFNAQREQALRIFRYGNYARVNQFDVEQNLAGLEEKFRVYNKDGLANALRERLDELIDHSTKWTPEVLHLLLELSDRPVHKSRLEDLESLYIPEHVEPRLQWKDLVKEDPLLRDKLWKNIDYSLETSDDESYSSSDFERSTTDDSAQSSLDDAHASRLAGLTISIDSIGLNKLYEEQFWRFTKNKPQSVIDAYFEKAATYPITDLQAIRETLFMLQGLPTTLYTVAYNAADSSNTGAAVLLDSNDHGGTVQPIPGFISSVASSHVLYDVFMEFSRYGTSLRILRNWTPVDKTQPLLQRLHEQLQTRLQELNDIFSGLEGQYLEPERDIVVSLAATRFVVASHMQPFEALAKLVREHGKSMPHRWLEALYGETCKFQSAENNEMYEFMGRIFFDCFTIYLRPIRRWMEDGELSAGNEFFIKEDRENSSRMTIWEKYTIQNDDTGAPFQTPRFVSTRTHKILTSGKSIVVLKELKPNYKCLSRPPKEPLLCFQTVCGDYDSSLLPFSELFDAAFEAWIQSKLHSTASILQKVLLDSRHLDYVLQGLEAVYFMGNGAASSAFASTIFDNLSRGITQWNNPFALTSHLRSTIGQGVGKYRISIKVASSAVDVLTARRTVKSLATINICYEIPWDVALVIRPSTLDMYKRVATFLLQIRRASYTLTCSRSRVISALPLYYGLRTNLLWFSSTLYSYITETVVSLSMKNMRKDMATADELDDMIEIHDNFVKKVAAQALLGSRLELIHKTILQILDLAIALEDAQAARVNPTVHLAEEERHEADSDSDFDSDSENEQELSIFPDQKETPYPERLRVISNEFERLYRFVLVGLRGAARVGKESNWDILVEKLEFGLNDGDGRQA